MAFECLDVGDCVGFDWDDGNILKNEKKHNLHWQTIEELFFNEPLLVVEDSQHSKDECRCNALGYVDSGLKLFVSFTKRDNKIRVISARPMNKKEKNFYENFKTNTKI